MSAFPLTTLENCVTPLLGVAETAPDKASTTAVVTAIVPLVTFVCIRPPVARTIRPNADRVVTEFFGFPE